MSEDRFEEYSKLASKLGFEFRCSEDNKRLHLAPNDPICNKKFFYLRKEDTAFFALDSYAAKQGSSTTFSGVYRALPTKGLNVSSFISKRFWFDPLVGCYRVKMGNSYLDKHLSVETNNSEHISRMLDIPIANKFLALWKAYPPIRLVITTDYLDFPADFKDKLIIGVEKNQWIRAVNLELVYADCCEILDMMQKKL